MQFKIKRNKFTPAIVGTYFILNSGETAYKVVYVEDGDIRFAYYEYSLKVVVISSFRFKMDEFDRNLKKGSLIQIDFLDHRIPLPLLSYEVNK